MMSLYYDKQADIIDAFNFTLRYLDDILNINNVCFDNMVSQIYPSANISDTGHMSISNDIVSTKNVAILIVGFSVLMLMFLALHPMESISLNSFVSLEHLAMC